METRFQARHTKNVNGVSGESQLEYYGPHMEYIYIRRLIHIQLYIYIYI
jgi:hypothetical protein